MGDLLQRLGLGITETTEKTYLVGTLTVDLFDACSHKIIWQGVGVDTLSSKPEKAHVWTLVGTSSPQRVLVEVFNPSDYFIAALLVAKAERDLINSQFPHLIRGTLAHHAVPSDEN